MPTSKRAKNGLYVHLSLTGGYERGKKMYFTISEKSMIETLLEEQRKAFKEIIPVLSKSEKKMIEDEVEEIDGILIKIRS